MKVDYLPRETSEILNFIQYEGIDNSYLSWNRYNHSNSGGKGKKTNLKEIERIHCYQSKIFNTLDDKISLAVQQTSRWAIGIGGTTPFGNLLVLALHPLYGIPYIPASALKGLLRKSWLDAVNCEEEDIYRLFGSGSGSGINEENSTGNQGQLIFFDSFPNSTHGNLILDVITPHYSNYYSGLGDSPPTDDQNPIPIEFLCLNKFEFKITIGSYYKLGNDDKIKITKAIEYAFSHLGIGAKTALGYGRGKLKK